MPKVTRDRGERYGGSGGPRSSYSSSFGQRGGNDMPPFGIGTKPYEDGLNKTLMGPMPPLFVTSTPLVKTKFPLFEANLSPLVNNSATPIGKQSPIGSGFFQVPRHVETLNTFNSINSGERFKVPQVPKPKLPQIKEATTTTPGLSSRTTEEDSVDSALMKGNMMLLNKKFVADIVKILKSDNAACLIPAACQYLLHSISIVSINSRSGLTNLTKFIRETEKQVNRVNEKVAAVKEKTKNARKSIKEKKSLSEKKTTNTNVKEPAVKAVSTWTTGKDPPGNRKREREESTSPTQTNFNAFNGGSTTHSLPLKRSKDDKTFSASPTMPTKPLGSLCNGLSPQSMFDNTKPFKLLEEIKNSANTNSTDAPTSDFGSGFFTSKALGNSFKVPQGFGFGSGIDTNHKQDQGFQQQPSAGFFGASGNPPIFPLFPTNNTSTDTKPIGGGNFAMTLGNFASVKPPDPTPAVASNSAEDDEDAEPPKYEFVPVVEETALFSKRCKLFEKKDGSFKDRGIGVLYINEIKTDKFQVVIRADNSLGTLLLNMMLSSELPLQKSGKNNVLTVDPTADAGKGVPILIRVKTEEDADELIGKLNELKEKSS